jgi:hypothetical protein
MRALLERAGFHRSLIRTRNSRFMWQQSLMLRQRRPAVNPGSGGAPAPILAASMLALLETIWLVASANSGEWLDVQAFRD